MGTGEARETSGMFAESWVPHLRKLLSTLLKVNFSSHSTCMVSDSSDNNIALVVI